jgi:threonine/homoserine/homoserine lactone efflux protein
MSYPTALGFVAVSLAVIVAPGPSVLFAVSRAIAAGRRTALWTVLGNGSGLFLQVLIVAGGLGAMVVGSEAASSLLTSVGAIYLVWLGISAIRHRADAIADIDPGAIGATATPWRDGFVVGATNPKTMVLLAAYVDPDAGHAPAQMVALGALFCLIAMASDGAWAVLAARARAWFGRDPRRLSWTSATGGLVMVGLGLLLATS